MPWASTSTVAPSFEFEAVFTTAPEAAELACADGALVSVDALLLFAELPPHAETSADTASAGMSTFMMCRM
jgi:hypothetical protein